MSSAVAWRVSLTQRRWMANCSRRAEQRRTRSGQFTGLCSLRQTQSARALLCHPQCTIYRYCIQSRNRNWHRKRKTQVRVFRALLCWFRAISTHGHSETSMCSETRPVGHGCHDFDEIKFFSLCSNWTIAAVQNCKLGQKTTTDWCFQLYDVYIVSPVGALTLFVRWQEVHPARKNIAPSISKGSSLEELRETWSNLEWDWKNRLENGKVQLL